MAKRYFLDLPKSPQRISKWTIDDIISRISGIDINENHDASYECILALANKIKELEDKIDNHKGHHESDNRISPYWLMTKHPELTYMEAENLMYYAMSLTIYNRSCYGDGNIIYPKWKKRRLK